MESTQLVQLGDLHAAPGSRNADVYAALDHVITEGLALPRLGAWLWPGDLFHALSAIADRNALDVRLKRMASVAPVVICYGNHDAPGDLDGFANLESSWPITVVDRPCCIRIRLAGGRGGNATVFVLPYPHKGGLVGAGVAAGQVVETASDLLEPIFMQAAAELEAARTQGDVTLMIGHVNVSGALASTGQPNIGREIELHPKHLDRLGPIYKGLNHIHKPQEIAGAYYAGSICRLSYGETEEKRFLVIDIPRDPELRPLVESRSIPIAPMFLIDGRLDRLGFHCVLPQDESGPISWAGADVRVRYHYRASERAVLDPSVIPSLFTRALRLKIEGVAEPDRDVRAPEVAAAKTLSDKLAAFRKVPALPPATAEKLAWLERGNPEQLLADVAARIRAIEFPEKAQVAA